MPQAASSSTSKYRQHFLGPREGGKFRKKGNARRCVTSTHPVDPVFELMEERHLVRAAEAPDLDPSVAVKGTLVQVIRHAIHVPGRNGKKRRRPFELIA